MDVFLRPANTTMHVMLNRSIDYHVRLHGASAPTVPLLETTMLMTGSFDWASSEEADELLDDLNSKHKEAMRRAPTPCPVPPYEADEGSRSFLFDHHDHLAPSQARCCVDTTSSSAVKYLIENGLISERYLLAIKLHLMQHSALFHLILKVTGTCKALWTTVGLTNLNAAVKSKGKFNPLSNPTLANKVAMCHSKFISILEQVSHNIPKEVIPKPSM